MIQIKDCEEPLVDIQKLIPDLVINLEPVRLKVEKSAFLRQTIAHMLKKARESLPEGYTFIINDAWRPVDVQKRYFDWRLKMFKERHPDWDEKKIVKETSKYVAPYKGKKASGHLTGASVDLRLFKNGKKVPMISSKLTFQENASSFPKKLPKYLQKNREILFEVMSKAGFTNYPKEYWHWCYGDYMWAKLNKKNKAIYGVVNNPKINP